MFKTKALILLTVFIDIIGMGIVIPILPFYVASYNNSPLLITSLKREIAGRCGDGISNLEQLILLLLI